MSDSPIRDSLNRPIEIPTDIPKNTVTIAGEFNRERQGGSIEFNRDIGKPGGWEAVFTAEYWRKLGASIRGGLTWSK